MALRQQEPWRDEHEAAFILRLPRILQWARHLAKQQEIAEDLAQEAFIAFTGVRSELRAIRDVDAYLYTLLRNLHRSELSRAQRFYQFPPDLDPADPAAVYTDLADERLAAQRSDLLQLCRFALERRHKSKGGSVILLRFFHGYVAERVAEIMGTTRGVLAERLRMARREAREALLAAPCVDVTALHLLAADDSAALRAKLREVVFMAGEGNCPSEDALDALYLQERRVEVDRKTLAHVVCCRSCLRRIEERLNARGDGDGSGLSAAAREEMLGRWRSERDDRLRMDPRELRVAVNGHLLAACRVAAGQSRWRFSVMFREPIDFAEVFTEDGRRIALLPVEPPPDGPAEQGCQVRFASGRQLSLWLSFDSPWPCLAVEFARVAIPEPADELCPLPAPVRWPETPAEPRARRRWPSWLTLPRLSPVIASLIIAVLVLVTHREAALSAAEVLRTAATWEQRARTPGKALRRVFRYERIAAGRRLHGKVEIVWNPARAQMIGRLFGEDGRLIEKTVAAIADRVSRNEEFWRVPPSAGMFDTLSIRLSEVRVERSSGRFVLVSPRARLVLDAQTGEPLSSEILGPVVHRFEVLETRAVPVAEKPFAAPVEARVRVERIESPAPAPVVDYDALELKVRRALLPARDEIGTLEVARSSGAIQVSALATSEQQREWIQSLLANLAPVESSIRTLEEAALEPSAPIQEVQPAAGLKQRDPLLAEVMDRHFGSRKRAQEHADRLMEAHRRLLADARSLREWAERYSPAVETALPPGTRQELGEVVRELTASLRARMQARDPLLAQLLALVPASLPEAPAAPACGAWQDAARELDDQLWSQRDTLLLLFHERTAAAEVAPPAETVLRDLLSRQARIRQLLFSSCAMEPAL